VLAPRHFADVNQTFYTRSNFYECAIVGHHYNLALYMVAHLEVRVESIPRMWGQLLQTKCDALLLVVEVEDDNVDLLVVGNNLCRVADAAP